MSLVDTEQVLVIPTRLLHRLGYFQGFTEDVERYLVELLSPEHVSYQPRGKMERDPSFKQLIPYVIFRFRDTSSGVELFQYTRGTGQGEARLHRKRSIGVGGHISLDDAAASEASPYGEGMRRELNEEVAVRTAYSQQCVGLINDDLTDVGKVHLGVVHLVDVESPEVHPKEREIVEAGFQPLDQLLAAREDFETWSQICMQALFGDRS